MYYRNPLSEKRKFFLQNAFAPRFHLDEEAVKGVSSEELKVRQARLSELLSYLSQADPSHSGKYVMWIAKLYFKETIQFPEDINKINQRLTQFDSIKGQLPPESRDINCFKTYGQLAETIDEHTGVSKRESVRISTAEGQEVLFNYDIDASSVSSQIAGGSKKFTVVKVTTSEAATVLARHTDWCIKDPSWSKGYLEWGPFYFIDKRTINGQKRYVLAWHGKCNRRQEQFQKYLKFIKLIESRGHCLLCKEKSEAGSISCINHYEDLQMLVADTTRYYEFNETLNDDLWLLESYPQLVQILKDFMGSTCNSRYDIMNVYDEDLKEENPKQYQEIFPILKKLFAPDVSEPRKNLLSYYELGPGIDEDWKQQLLASKDPTKLVDYFEYLVDLEKEKKGIEEPHAGQGRRRRGRGRKRKRRGGKAAPAPKLTLRRWKEAEKHIFTDYQQAARYYTLIYRYISKSDDAALRVLGAALEVPSELPELDIFGQLPLTENWRGRNLKNTRVGLAATKARKKVKLKGQIVKMQQQIAALDETFQLKFDRVDALMVKHSASQEKRRGVLATAALAAEEKLADGASLYRTLAPLVMKFRNAYDHFDVDDFEPTHPAELYLTDLINYYGKGMVIVPEIIFSSKVTVPSRLVAAGEFIDNIHKYIKPKARRKHKNYKAERMKKALDKLGKFARAANSAVNRMRRRRF